MQLSKFYLIAFLVTTLILSAVIMCSAEEIDVWRSKPLTTINWDKLISAVIQVESGGDYNAVSPQGCIGLMQINPNGALAEWNNTTYQDRHYTYYSDGTSFLEYRQHEKYTRHDLLNMDINIKIGTWYLHRIEEHYLKEHLFNVDYADDTSIIKLILAAYNGGITRLKKCNYDINCMPRETRNYVRKVMRIYKGE